MRLFPPALLAVALVACGAIAPLEPSAERADAGTADAATEPPFDGSQCPREAVPLPASREERYLGAAYAGGGVSVGLSASGTVRRFRFTASGVVPDGDAAPAPVRGSAVRALPNSAAFTIGEGFSDAEARTVKVFGPGFTELATLSERNTRFEDLDREGISRDGQIAYPFVGRGTNGVAIAGGSIVCMACTLSGVADTSLYVFQEGHLERRSLAAAFPGVDVERRVPIPNGDGTEAPRLVGATRGLLLFTRGRERAVAHDRETLAEVPFGLEPSEVPTGVVEQPDGTIDLFSVQYGELAFASHRDATGKILQRGPSYAAYGFANPTPCGFWVEGTHIPFAR